MKEAMKLALEALEAERDNYQDWDEKDGAPEYIYEAITALREALAEQPSQQCKWPTCQSEEYQQALAEQIKRELVGEQPAQPQQEPVVPDMFWNQDELVRADEREACAKVVEKLHPGLSSPRIAEHIRARTSS